jgi:membrane fusion protein, macrolide-specific efflux system
MNDSTNSPIGHRRKSTRGRNAIIAAVVLAAAGGGWYAWQKQKASTNKEGEYLTAFVSRGDIEDLVTSTGTLQPRDYVDVGAQVSGQIEKIYVEVGDVVQKGDALAEIDATTAIAKVDGLKAQLLNAETNLKTQETNLEKADRDLKRLENLLAADATTKETVLNQRTTFANAERSIISSKAQIEVQKANLRIEERNLGFTKIIAPIAGTVMSIKVKEGQTVNATQNVPNVMQIANLNTMTVQAEVSEADVAKLYDGIPVYFTTLGGGNRRWYSELKRKEPTPKVQNSVVLYNALFDVANDSGSLMPQMTAQVYFVSSEAKQVLMVPMAALQQGQQIARELAQKEREKNGAKGASGTPGAGPGAPGGPGAAPPGAATGAGPQSAPGAAAPAAVAGAGREGATAPAAGAQGARPGGGAPGAGGAGGFNGPRPGGNGAGGPPGGFNPQNMTPEQLEQMRARMRAGGGFGGGQGGGFNGQRGAGGPGANGQRAGGQRAGGAAMGAAAPRQTQRRNGTVMVKKADGALEARRVVIGVTNRVQGEVLEGLQEGEEVIVGKREEESASRPANTNNNQGNRQGGPAGGFPGGGFPGGGGGRPF